MAASAGLGEFGVEVVFSPAPREVDLVPVRLSPGATLLHAIRASGLLERHPSIDLGGVTVGVWGRSAKLSDPAQPGDRIEIYRPLKVDPKEARRQRYRAQGERGRNPRRKVPAGG